VIGVMEQNELKFLVESLNRWIVESLNRWIVELSYSRQFRDPLHKCTHRTKSRWVTGLIRTDHDLIVHGLAFDTV
jgi:hypothetical protein